MRYEEISILEAARRCKILNTDKTDRKEVEVTCPFCSDRKRHMYLNTVKNQFHCQLCKIGGNSVTLYAQLMGIDNTTAYLELTSGEIRFSPVLRQKTEKSVIECRTIQDRHNVYYDLLNMSVLSETHKANLLNRGLDETAIQRLMYKTVPTGLLSIRIATELAKNYDLNGIPGFYTYNGQARMIQRDGIFVPSCEERGLIQGLHIRLDNEEDKKFRWFASWWKENGGEASNEWLHISGWNGQNKAVITEGFMKADIACYFTEDTCYIGLPGHSSYNGLIPLLQKLGINHAAIALDMDRILNKGVKKSIDAISRLLFKAQIGYEVYTWEPDFKGIDDLLYHKYLCAMQAA